MTTELLPPLSAIGNLIIEIYGPDSAAARWDEAVWDGVAWAAQGWHDVTPQSMVMKLSWGADDPAGVLTVPSAGSWSIETYDPSRVLDPANGGSQFSASLRPGRPMRVSVQEPGKSAKVLRVGLIDQITYDIREKRGSIRGTDVVPLIVQAKLGAGQNDDPAMPKTLRARARYILNKVGLSKIVEVEPPPGTGNVTPDGGAEKYDDHWEITPPGWSLAYGAGTFGTSSGKVVTGSRAFTMRSAGTASAWVGTGDDLKYTQSVIGGAQYTLSGWRQREGWGDSRVTIWLDYYNIEGAGVGNSQAAGGMIAWEPGGMADEWVKRESAPFAVPADAAWVTIAIGADGGGADWVDDITVFGPMANEAQIPDPPVGPLPNDRDSSAWSLIGTSAFDALYAMWVDRNGMLRFRSFGSPRDNGFIVGGDEGIPISTIKTNASLANVYTAVRAFDDDAPTVPVYAVNPASADLYGIITLTRDKPVPDARVWVDSVLADRAGAGLQYETGTLYPRTFAELMAIVALEMVDIVHLVADDVVPPLNVAARLLGVRMTGDTDTGWTAEIVSYIPANEWEEAETPPPIEPPVEPPGTTQQVVRYYDATKDSRAARDSGGNALGSGTEGELPVGAWSGWRNRAFIAFASIPWGGVVSVDKCELELDTSSQVNIGFGSSPKVTVKRVTQGWSEGSSSSPSGSNSLKYPGPSVTSTDAKSATVTKSENAAVSIDITAIARAWRNGSGQYGVGIFSAGEDSTQYTTEFWSRENSTSGKRPRLKMTLTVEV